jgi:hypothetical protein
MKFLLLNLFFFSLALKAAPVPSKFRYELHLGKGWSNYTEERDSVIIADRDINQESYFGEFQTTYWAIPKYIDFNLGLRQLGFNATSDGTEEEIYTLQNVWLNLGFHFPLFYDYLWIKIVGEGFYANMNSQDGFGFRNLNGGSIYPGVEYFPKGTDKYFSISPYIRVPVISGSNVWREYSYGLKFKLPIVRGRPQFPLYAYQKAIVIRLVYSKFEIAIRKAGYLPVDASHAWTGLSVGYEW